MFIGQGLLMTTQSLVLLVSALLILLFTNPRLMVVILPVLPIAFIVFLLFGRITQPMFMKVQIKLSKLNTILQENLAGIRVVKAFVREPEQQARFEASAEDLMQQQIQVARAFSFLFPVVFLIANLGQAAVYYFGGVQIINGTLTLGEWQKFSLYLAYVSSRSANSASSSTRCRRPARRRSASSRLRIPKARWPTNRMRSRCRRSRVEWPSTM